ncbi:MAG: MCE family protein [Armatimonadetes bacterium]|nr:MCE family protein [Armatimonadota bacterium]
MEINSAAKVGMIAVLAILVLGLIFSQIGNWKEKDEGYILNIIFDNVEGLQVNSPVRLAGVNIGKVKEISILPIQKIKVVILITYKDLGISRDSIFTVSSSLWGEKSLEIIPKQRVLKEELTAPIVRLNPGEEIKGKTPATLNQLITEGQGALRQFKETIGYVNQFVGEPKVQKDLKKTIANFQEISNNLKVFTANTNIEAAQLFSKLNQMADSLQLETKRIGSQLYDFSYSIKKIVKVNASDARLIVKNLKETSHNLNLAIEAIKALVTKGQFSEDILSALASFRKTSQEVEEIASDIHSITGDPQIKTDVENTIHEARETVANANILLKKLNTFMGGNDFKGMKNKILNLDAGSEWAAKTGLVSPNVNLQFFPESPDYTLKLGVDNIGYGKLYNLQIGRNFKNFRPRFGIVRSQLGIGVDSSLSKLFNLSLDFYDPRNAKMDFLGRIYLGGDFYITGGLRDAFNNKITIFGAGKRF